MNEHEKVGGIHKRPDIKKVWANRSDDEKVSQHLKARGFPYVQKGLVLGHEVYIGTTDEINHDKPEEYPEGYYMTAFVVKGRLLSVQDLETSASHDITSTPARRLALRAAAAEEKARFSIALGVQGGMYEK